MKSLLRWLVFPIYKFRFLPGGRMRAYAYETKELKRAGKYEEALERHIWFHNNVLEYNPVVMYGVRLSFALAEWRDLGDVYPPALEAMIEMRNRKTDEMNNGKGDFDLFHDVTALNQTLGENQQTVELFHFLDENDPKLGQECWSVAKEYVLAAGRVDLAKKYLGEPSAAWQDILKNHKLLKKMRLTRRIRSDADPTFVRDVVLLLWTLNQLGEMEAAKEIQKEALSVLDNGQIRKILVGDVDE